MAAARHRVYLYFFHSTGWYCQFLEADLKTPLPRKLNFGTPDKIVELVRRTGSLKDLACRQALEHGIEMGRGGVFLNLTDEQYAALKGPKLPPRL